MRFQLHDDRLQSCRLLVMAFTTLYEETSKNKRMKKKEKCFEGTKKIDIRLRVASHFIRCLTMGKLFVASDDWIVTRTFISHKFDATLMTNRRMWNLSRKKGKANF